MAWDDEIPLLLRNYIGDTSATPTYSDDSLIQVILSAAQFVIVDAPLSQDYQASVTNVSLKPDPTSYATTISRDNAFINLLLLKAVWMIASAEIRTYGSQAIAIKDGTSSVDLKRDIKALNQIVESHKEAYFEFKNRYIRENWATCELITSPIRIFPTRYFGFWPYSGPALRNDRW